MGGSLFYRVEQPSAATPEAVYDALMDLDHWKDWTPIISAASWEQPGAPGTGEGGIRRVRLGALTVREQIVGGTRPHHQAYTMLTNSARLPTIDNYRAFISIDERPNGSLITWTGTYTSRIPGLGQPLQSVVRWVIARSAAGLARLAEG
jgi:hypothetical protein